MLRFPGISIPGHTAVAPPGQANQSTRFDVVLTSKFSQRQTLRDTQSKWLSSVQS
ncbi:MAG: hypothetical protein AB7H80_12470 [Candidatus Kapaibacterium sp.]